MSWRDKYPGCIIVRCVDRMTFPVDPATLEPLACSCYDAHCYSDPEPAPLMSCSEWEQQFMGRRVNRGIRNAE